MDIERAFDDLQTAVDADPALVNEARERRRRFEAAFGRESDVRETVAIGSIARGSQIEPIKDVDLVIVYDGDEHPEWGSAGPSAEKALDETQRRIVGFFGSEGSEERDFVRLARADNHAVKCFLDDPDDPDAFTVDVVPALRVPTGRLRITEKESQDWIDTDPEHLNNCVASRHAAWAQFVRLVRVLKRWNRDHEATMLPLLIEVMAIDHLHEGKRSRALQSFFAAAAVAVSPSITDPAGISPIQPDLDVAAARAQLEKAADLSWRAVAAEERGETDRAGCYWREIFGEIFPEPAGGCTEGGNGLGAAAAGASIGSQVRRPARHNPQG